MQGSQPGTPAQSVPTGSAQAAPQWTSPTMPTRTNSALKISSSSNLLKLDPIRRRNLGRRLMMEALHYQDKFRELSSIINLLIIYEIVIRAVQFLDPNLLF